MAPAAGEFMPAAAVLGVLEALGASEGEDSAADGVARACSACSFNRACRMPSHCRECVYCMLLQEVMLVNVFEASLAAG